MRKIWIIIFINYTCFCYSQENWILYPKKETLDSLKVKSISKEVSTTKNYANAIVFNMDSPLDSLKSIPVNYISEQGSLIENKDSRIESIISHISKYGTYKGYTIQIYVSQETSKISEMRKNFISNFPEQILFDGYKAPNIFLYSGKFKDYNKEELFREELKKVFENTLIVRKKFKYKIEKKLNK